MYEVTDDMFAQFVADNEQKSRTNNQSSSYNKADYPTIEWTGLETGTPTVVRVMGGPPNAKTDEFNAKKVTIAWLTADDGSKFKLIRPSFEEDSNYIINRIINRVKRATWNNGVKTFPVKENYPEIFNIIDKNGIKADDPKYKYEKGWMGREVIIMNVIDRGRMDWHRANKHSVLLAKTVTEKNGNNYVDEGISSFVLLPKINQLFKYYGSWEKYDIAITKTGDLNNAFNVVNASKNPEMIDPPPHDTISYETHLTDEEKSWERYDIAKIYHVTSYTKIYNRLKNTIKRIDGALGTDFLTELKGLMEKESEERERLQNEESSKVETTSLKESFMEDEPDVLMEETPVVTRRREPVSSVSSTPGSEMPFYNTLPDKAKSSITKCEAASYTKKDGSVGTMYNIEWSEDPNNLAKCPVCGTISPLYTTVCCGCGHEF